MREGDEREGPPRDQLGRPGTTNATRNAALFFENNLTAALGQIARLPKTLRSWVRRRVFGFYFLTLGFRRDVAADPLYEIWLRVDSRPPSPSAFSAARKMFTDEFIVRAIADRSELGPEGLDVLRADLVGFLRRRCLYQEDEV